MSKSIYKKFNYVYQIAEANTDMKYIGVRGANIKPEYDLGTNYFSSSSNKEFIKNQKNNISNYIYSILSIHDNRCDAINEEIRLHELYDVENNIEYYNKKNQTKTTVIFKNVKPGVYYLTGRAYVKGYAKNYTKWSEVKKVVVK